MWLRQEEHPVVKNGAPKLFMMAKLKRGHSTARSIILATPPDMVKDKSGEVARLQSD